MAADISSYVLGYAISCAQRNLSYMHYRMNYGRRPEHTDYFQVNRVQYDTLVIALCKANNTEH